MLYDELLGVQDCLLFGRSGHGCMNGDSYWFIRGNPVFIDPSKHSGSQRCDLGQFTLASRKTILQRATERLGNPMVSPLKAIPLARVLIPSLNIPSVENPFAYIAAWQPASLDFKREQRQVSDPRIEHISGTYLGIS